MILYGVKNCKGCEVAMSWLERNSVSYAYIDLDESHQDKLDVVRTGIRSVPAMKLDGKIMSFEDAKAYLEARFGNG